MQSGTRDGSAGGAYASSDLSNPLGGRGDAAAHLHWSQRPRAVASASQSSLGQRRYCVTDFLAKSPTLDSNWRAVVLFGRNVASYKLALAKTLLSLADRADDRVLLEDLVAPFAGYLYEHLRHVDKQTTSRSSQFLDAH
jgi:hypothetical protein